MTPYLPGGRGSPGAVWPAALSVLATAAVGCAPGGPPTWADDVATVVHASCVQCHRPEGPGPMPLLTWEDAAPIAGELAEMTSTHRMPPWLPAREGPRFRDERILTEAEILLIRRWAEAGAPRGDPAREPPPPTFREGWVLGEPDLVVEMDEPFVVPAAHHHDLYRNFVLAVPLEEGRWVRAVEFRPDNPAVIHHATIQVDPTRNSRLLAALDPEPGYDDRVFHSAARPPGGFFLAWTPGLVPAPYPEGMAWRLNPGTDLVVQLHLFPTGRPESVRVRVGLHFTDREPTRPPMILRLGGQTIDIPPGDPRYVVRDSFTLPVEVEVLGVYPHAHFLGRRVEARAVTRDGRIIPLLTIPRWDFNWQDAYYYRTPLRIPGGSTLHMEWVFDNSAENPANPHDPPRRVTWGMNSTDEMAEFWLQVVVDGAEARAVLEAAARRNDAIKQIEGWEHLVALDPRDADAQRGLASVAQARGDHAEALRRYRLALEADPRMPATHLGLGHLLQEMGDLEGARRSYEAALAIVPGHPAVLSSLGSLLAIGGDIRRAQEFLERAVAADPHHEGALNNLGSLLRDTGQTAEAVPFFRRALAVDPDFTEARFNLALSLLELGDRNAGVEALEAAFRLDPANADAALQAAWLLATHPEPRARDPELAADLALQVRDAVGPGPVVSDVAAAALAAGGDFSGAVQLAGEAVAAAEEAGWSGPRLEALRGRLALYVTGRAFVAGR